MIDAWLTGRQASRARSGTLGVPAERPRGFGAKPPSR